MRRKAKRSQWRTDLLIFASIRLNSYEDCQLRFDRSNDRPTDRMSAILNTLRSIFFPPAPTSEQTMAAAARIESIISKAGSIAVFSKSYCPYCTTAKGILSSYSGIKPRLQVGDGYRHSMRIDPVQS